MDRLVKRARFQNEVVAENFAAAVRREGFKACCGRNWESKTGGFEVRWAPTWEHFRYDC